jgi:hypothetical protein
MGRVVVEAETAEAARDKVERRGYIVLDVNRDNSNGCLDRSWASYDPLARVCVRVGESNDRRADVRGPETQAH